MITTGYAYFHRNSGILGKFIPYHPAINVKGRKIVVTTVRILIVERKNTESYLTNEHISIITSIYTRYTNIDGRSKIINNNEIPDNKYSISPKFYVKSNDPKDIEDISELLENWKSNSESLHESFTNLIDLL